MRRLLRPLWFVIAVLFLVEEGLWRRLAAAIGRIVDALGLPRLRARLTAVIERLPPAAALLLFLVPGILLLPVKLLGLWLLAHGHWLGAVGTLLAAKVAGAGVTAFIFQATKPRLLQMAWFRWVYRQVTAILAWAHRQIDPLKARARAALEPLAARARAAWAGWRARPRGPLLRRLLRLRRRAQRS